MSQPTHQRQPPRWRFMLRNCGLALTAHAMDDRTDPRTAIEQARQTLAMVEAEMNDAKNPRDAGPAGKE